MERVRFSRALLALAAAVFALLLAAALPASAHAYTTGDDYPYKGVPAYTYIADDWNFFKGECTSFVAWCLNTRNGLKFTNQYLGEVKWSDAKNWDDKARAHGITVDSNPAVGAVAQTDSGECGHVAWVSAVDGDQVTIEEYNYEPAYGHAFSQRTVEKSEFCYIHFKDIVLDKRAEQSLAVKPASRTVQTKAVKKHAKKLKFKVSGAKTSLVVGGLTKTQRKAIEKVKVKGDIVAVTVKKGAKAGAYKIAVYAKENEQYKRSETAYLKVKVSASVVAKAAYKKFVKKHKTTSYKIVDIDQDGIPELIRTNWSNYGHREDRDHPESYGGLSYVYSYSGGKVKLLKKTMHARYGEIYYNTKSHCFGFYKVYYGAHYEYKFYDLKNSKVVKTITYTRDRISGNWEFNIGGDTYGWSHEYDSDERLAELNTLFDEAIEKRLEGYKVISGKDA